MKSQKHPKRVGLFGGTFDPVHFGHINLAIELKEKCDLNEVWVIPAYVSPFRNLGVAPQHRLEMVKRAFLDIEGFKVLDIEVTKEGSSYTIDTVKRLKEEFPEIAFTLLLGEDAAARFFEWKESDKILSYISLAIGRRGQKDLKKILENAPCPPEIKETLIKSLVNTTYMEIEATTIRKRIEKKLYCKHLIPSKVMDYIYQNQLYFIP